MNMSDEKWEQICDSVKDEFTRAAKKIKHERAGVCYHEALAFAALCRDLKVDFIFESGTASGISTRLWAEIFPDIKIVTVDNLLWEKKVGLDLSKDRELFKNYSNIEFVVGDSRKIFEGILDKNIDKRIAVFLDGPKDKPAIRLAEKLLDRKNVSFVAIDDMGQTKIAKRGLHVWKAYDGGDSIKKIFHTSTSQWFVDKYGSLDKELGNKQPKGHGIGFLARA